MLHMEMLDEDGEGVVELGIIYNRVEVNHDVIIPQADIDKRGENLLRRGG